MTARQQGIKGVWLAAGLALLDGSLASRAAEANGRFPTSDFLVVGPGADSSLMVLRTTFGLVVSTNRGRDWSWICEDAYGSTGMWDAPPAIGMDGTVILGLPGQPMAMGITTSTGLCDWHHPVGDPGYLVEDLAWDAVGARIVAGVQAAPDGMTEADGLSISDDGGHTWRTGARISNFFLQTVEVAPSRPQRIYVSGYGRGGIAELLRSDDGGMTLVPTTHDFTDPTVSGVFVSGVDPTNPDVVYVRANAGLGTLLLRSDDGGMSFHPLTRTTHQMVGFALSDDGQTVWGGSEDRTEGIVRSVHGGPFTRVMADTQIRCMRYHGGVLYICGDDSVDGYAVGWSMDGGDHINALMSLRDVAGPVAACASGTPEHDLCGMTWPTQRMILMNLDAATARPRTYFDAGNDVTAAMDAPDVPPGDGAVSDGPDDVTAPVDSGPPPMDAAIPDVQTVVDTGGTAMDAWYPDVPVRHPTSPVPAPASNCGCRVGSRETTDPAWAVGVGATGLIVRRRRRRR